VDFVRVESIAAKAGTITGVLVVGKASELVQERDRTIAPVNSPG